MSPTAPEDVVRFHEIQRPRWTLGTLVLAALVGVHLTYYLVLGGRGPRPMDIVQAAILLLLLLAAMSHLRTVVQGRTLELERRWGGRLELDLDRVRAVRITAYYPRIDGGWGVRDGQGVILTRDDGDVLYVGSARAKELCEVIRGLLPTALPGALATRTAAR